MFAFPWPRAASLTLIAAALLGGCDGPKSPIAAGPGAQLTGAPNGAADQPPRAPVPSASAGGTAATLPACSYITRAEMAGLLGAPVGSLIEERSEGTTSCANLFTCC